MTKINKNNSSKFSIPIIPRGTIYLTEPEFVGPFPNKFPDVSKMMGKDQNQPNQKNSIFNAPILISSEQKNYGVPVKTELTVLSADDCKNTKLGWTVVDSKDHKITDLNDVKITKLELNQEILVTTLIGILKMKVTKIKGNKRATAETEKSINDLYFDFEDRLWRSEPLLINKKCLENKNEQWLVMLRRQLRS